MCSRLYAVRAAAEIDVIEIHGKDFVFAEFSFQPERQPHFLQLARDGFLCAQVALADELHGDGAAPLRIAAFADVGGQRAEETHDIHAAVIVEPQILRSQKGLLCLQGNCFQRHDNAVFCAFDTCDQRACVVIHQPRTRRGGDAADVQLLPAGNVKGKISADEGNHRQAEQHD